MPDDLLAGLSAEDRERARADVERWRHDAVAFVWDNYAVGWEAEHPGRRFKIRRFQEKALRALTTSPRGIAEVRVALRACKGPGKTAFEVWVGDWFLTTRSHPKGVAVSITFQNLRDNLWTEFATWHRYSPLMTLLFEQTADKIRHRQFPEDWWISARSFQADADKTAQADTLSGLHADSVLVLLDEFGSGPQGVVDAALAVFNVAGVDALVVLCGNCTDVDGPLFRLCTTDAARWHIERVTGDPDDPDRCEELDLEEAKAIIAARGRNDPVVMVNWLGEFPHKGQSKLIGPDDVSRAEGRNPPQRAYENEPIIWGLDVAGEGVDPDKAVLYRRQGITTLGRPQKWTQKGSDDLADLVVVEVKKAEEQERRHPEEGRAVPDRIFVDMGGIGYGCYCALRRLLGEEMVVGVNFGSRAINDALYMDRRTEMHCNLADWIKRVGAIPADPELRRDLTAPNIEKALNANKGVRLKLESKDSMAKRGLPSTDDSDALALTCDAVAMATLSSRQKRSLAKAQAQAEAYVPPWERSVA